MFGSSAARLKKFQDTNVKPTSPTVPAMSEEDPTGAETVTADATASDDGPATDAEAEATDRRTLSPRVRYVWAIRLLVPVVVIGALVTFGATRVSFLPVWLGPLVALFLLAFGLVWVEARYRVWAFEVREDSLYLERGVLTHVRTIAPYVRIQHVDTQRSPLERWLGLSTLVVYTAGSRGADVSIPGLQPEAARDLQSRVKQLAIEAEGGDAV
jgi:membrane protein YdbS with pleckstrin-like domain